MLNFHLPRSKLPFSGIQDQSGEFSWSNKQITNPEVTLLFLIRLDKGLMSKSEKHQKDEATCLILLAEGLLNESIREKICVSKQQKKTNFIT